MMPKSNLARDAYVTTLGKNVAELLVRVTKLERAAEAQSKPTERRRTLWVVMALDGRCVGVTQHGDQLCAMKLSHDRFDAGEIRTFATRAEAEQLVDLLEFGSAVEIYPDTLEPVDRREPTSYT